MRRSGVGATLAERWNGTKWRIQPTPNPSAARGSILNAVACPTSKECIAAGNFLTSSGGSSTLAERWNGRRWSMQAIPNPPGAQRSFILGLSCTSASSCTAVGRSNGTALAERWNGTSWILQSPAEPSGAQFSELTSVACTVKSACVAVGDYVDGSGTDETLAESRKGSRWHVQPTPNPSGAQLSMLSSVACTSSAACTAVGAFIDSSGTFDTLAERWDGTTWGIQPTPNPSGAQFSLLFGVSCTMTSACTAVGGDQNASGTFVTLTERWDGTSWQIQSTVPGSQGSALDAVVCTSVTACTAVGSSHGSDTPLVLAERWDGTSWTTQPIPSPPGAAESQLLGVACTAPSACVGVGMGRDATLAERWNGTRWRTQAIPTRPGAGLSGVSCASRSFCMAVGVSSAGTVAERWNGLRWKLLHTPNPTGAEGAGLIGVTCSAPDACVATGAYFVGPNGAKSLAELWNGTGWRIVRTPNPVGSAQTFLGGVSCTSPSRCTAVGETHPPSGVAHTIAERWNGTRWRIQRTPNPPGVQNAILSGVACTAAHACIAVGGSDLGTLVERWNGTRWRILPAPNPPGAYGNSLNAVACAAAAACTAVGMSFTGLGGALLAERWNGKRWHLQPTPLIPGAFDMGLPGVGCPDRSACTAVSGYRSGGPGSVTLAEQWHGGASAGAVLSPALGGGPGGFMCLRSVILGGTGTGPARSPIRAVTEAESPGVRAAGCLAVRS